MANGGGTNGRTEGRTDGRLKIPPVFYRTSALWSRCPKKKRVGESQLPVLKFMNQITFFPVVFSQTFKVYSVFD